MIATILIENYRSIEKLEFDPQNLCALVGPNSSGKTNILKALNVLLGETYPTERAFSKDDFYRRDTTREIRIQVWFAEQLSECRLTRVDTNRKDACGCTSLELIHK